jgi:hypothetical protein
VTVTLVAELAAVAEFGETVQFASEGAPVQAKLTVPANPPSPTKLREYVADWPGAAVADVEEPDDAASVKSWPVPLSAMACGLLGALSETLMLPVRVPPAVGLNVTLIVQFAPALTLPPQELI